MLEPCAAKGDGQCQQPAHDYCNEGGGQSDLCLERRELLTGRRDPALFADHLSQPSDTARVKLVPALALAGERSDQRDGDVGKVPLVGNLIKRLERQPAELARVVLERGADLSERLVDAERLQVKETGASQQPCAHREGEGKRERAFRISTHCSPKSERCLPAAVRGLKS
jgi:hypothetical protein